MESYQPSPEEQKEAEEVVTPEQLEMSKQRDGALESQENDQTHQVQTEIVLTPEQAAATQEILKSLYRGDVAEAVKLVESFSLTKEVALSLEVQNAARERMVTCLDSGKFDDAISIKHMFLLPDEMISSREIQDKVVTTLLFYRDLGFMDINDVIRIMDIFHLPREAVSSPEVCNAVLLTMSSRLNSNDVDGAIEVRDAFLLPEEAVRHVAKEGMGSCLNRGNVAGAIAIRRAFLLPEEAVRHVAEKGLRFCLDRRDVAGAKKIIDVFSLSENTVQEIAQEGLRTCLHAGWVGDAVKIRDEFSLPEEICQEIAKEGMIIRLSKGEGGDAIDIIDRFSLPKEGNMSPEVVHAATEGMRACLYEGKVRDAVKVRDEFMLPEEICQEIAKEGVAHWLKYGSVSHAITIKNEFITQLTAEEQSEYIDICTKTGNIQKAFIFNKPVVNESLFLLEKYFGAFASAYVYHLCKDILRGVIDDEVRSLGVTQTGEQGVKQLAEIARRYTVEMVYEKENDTAKLQDSQTLRKLFAPFIRYDSAQFGKGSDGTMRETLANYEARKGEVAPLPSYLEPSEIIPVDSVDKETRVIWSEQFLSRYTTLTDSIKEAYNLVTEVKEDGTPRKPFSEMADMMQQEVDALVASLQEKLSQAPNEKARIGIEQRIQVLSEIEPRSLSKFQENIQKLYRFKELHPLVRKAVFAWSLAKNKDQHERVQELFDGEPSIDSVSTLLNFIDHITNQETFQDYFTDKKASDMFSDILNTRAISQDFAKAQNTDAVGTVPLQFVPQRNVFTEFSGHVGDACWASKYGSILESFPNFSSVIMVRDPGGKNERLVGSCMLIETTEANTGKPLLVIRGLNPLENVINSLSVKDFYEKFTRYVQDMAKKDGRRVVITVDDHFGGAGTNRPVLFEHMRSLWDEADKPTGLSEDTRFNGYDISTKTMVI